MNSHQRRKDKKSKLLIALGRDAKVKIVAAEQSAAAAMAAAAKASEQADKLRTELDAIGPDVAKLKAFAKQQIDEAMQSRLQFERERDVAFNRYVQFVQGCQAALGLEVTTIDLDDATPQKQVMSALVQNARDAPGLKKQLADLMRERAQLRADLAKAARENDRLQGRNPEKLQKEALRCARERDAFEDELIRTSPTPRKANPASAGLAAMIAMANKQPVTAEQVEKAEGK